MLAGSIPGEEDVVGSWCPPAEFERLALPTHEEGCASGAFRRRSASTGAAMGSGHCCARRLFVVGDEEVTARRGACGLGGK